MLYYEIKELAELKKRIKVIEYAPEFNATFRSLRFVISPDPSKTPAAKQQIKKPTKALFMEVHFPMFQTITMRTVRKYCSNTIEKTFLTIREQSESI